jgi:quinoprotein glucose dehydrogenase
MEWPSYGLDPAGTNFSPLTAITPENVAKLQPAWTWNYGAGTDDEGDRGLDNRWQVTPLVIDGVMYVSTPVSTAKPDLKATVTALVPETGEVLWRYESPYNIHARGLTYWPGDGTIGPRLIFGTDKGYLAALDVQKRTLAEGFGDGGTVDAYVGVVSQRVGEAKRDTWTLQNPLAIYKNTIITSARPGESSTPGPRSDIRGWDARTGDLLWSFHTVPQPGEPNFWGGEEWRDRTGANVWGSMVVDEDSAIVYATLGNLNGHAPGSELYANSLVALDANTGKLIWYRQITHRDLWNTDSPTPPILLDVFHEGRTVPALAMTGKHTLFFLFNRLTGEPLHPIEERPMPASHDPNVISWPTQPFPIRPGPLGRMGMTREEIPNITPEQYAYCTAFWDLNDPVSQGVYSHALPDRSTVKFPSNLGGPNWGGPSYNPDTGLFVVNMMNTANFRAAANQPLKQLDVEGQSGFTYRVGEDTILQCTPTPWGEMVAVDVAKGEIAWRSPLGDSPSLGDLGRNTGARNMGGNIQTEGGVVFVGATNDSRFRAFSAVTGDLLWTTELAASAHSTPITYKGRDGRQYVAVVGAGGTAVGSRQMSDTLHVFVLP